MCSLHSACLDSSCQTYCCHSEDFDLLAYRCCSAWDRKHRTDERAAGAVSVADGDELLESAMRVDHNTCRDGDGGCSCFPNAVPTRYGGGRFKASAPGVELGSSIGSGIFSR